MGWLKELRSFAKQHPVLWFIIQSTVPAGAAIIFWQVHLMRSQPVESSVQACLDRGSQLVSNGDLRRNGVREMVEISKTCRENNAAYPTNKSEHVTSTENQY